MKHLKLFETSEAYNAATLDLPNVSLIEENMSVAYNPWVETRIVAKFNVTNTSNSIKIASNTSNLTEIEIDGIVQLNVVSAYTFSTTGEHTVKYTLTDPTSISAGAFFECSGLTSIDIPDSVTSIGMSAFNGCSGLTSINIPDSVTSIGTSAFMNCSGITSITIPSGVTSISNAVFYHCTNLTNIDISDSVTSIGESAFNGCSNLTSITIPNSVTSIGMSAFYGCNGLTSCTIGSGVTSIGNGAFYNCYMLTSCIIGSGVTTIGNETFCNCGSLTSIVSNAATAPTIQSSTFRNTKTNGTLTVPSGSTGYDVWMGTKDYYLGSYNWTKVEQ